MYPTSPSPNTGVSRTLSLTAAGRLASAGKIKTFGSFQKAAAQSTLISPPKFVLSPKKAEVGTQLTVTESTTTSVSNSLTTTTTRATPSKPRAEAEEKVKTPQSSTKKSQTERQVSPSNSKSTPNKRRAIPSQDLWSSPRENGVNTNGAGPIVGMDDADNFWDEDMSLEMVTEAGEGDVDDEVRFLYPASLRD